MSVCVSQDKNPMSRLKYGSKGLIINKANFLSIADNDNVDTITQLSTTRFPLVFTPFHLLPVKSVCFHTFYI